jgi:hypothetical protein
VGVSPWKLLSKYYLFVCLAKFPYEKRLRESSEQNMQLKGESGILNKKFSSLGKEIEGHKQDKRRLQTEKEKLENSTCLQNF